MNVEETRKSARRVIAGLLASALFALFLAVGGATLALAETDEEAVASDISEIKGEIESKKANIDGINSRIGEYKRKITEQERKTASLSGEIELLENRQAKTELDIQATELNIGQVADEIRLLDRQTGDIDAQLGREREMLEDIVRHMQVADDRISIELLFSTESFSDLFDRLKRLENVNADLTDVLNRAEEARERVLALRAEQEGKRGRLTELHVELEQKRALGEQEKVAKESLLVASEKSEAQFSSLLSGLRQEEAYIGQQIALLQGKIESKLNELDDHGDSSVMSWPIEAKKGLSTLFHDPTYPFRHLFEHPGIDIPAPHGTPLAAAAPGYVAWTRTGSQYGNYVMIIHTNGLATLYAHLSSIGVSADQFVARGQLIGKTGGTPGTQGAGLSTGPHLHFEVRKDGIPVNPLKYLVTKP
jgi:murein DD-endopeptidase MepM/ murein hydrolase activator NlpD